MFKDKKVIIFDLDGTLIDSVGIWNAVDEKLIREIGGGPVNGTNIQKQRDDALKRFSKSIDPYLDYCGFLRETYHSGLPGEEIKKIRYEIANTYLEETVDFKPGAEKLLCYLKEKGFVLAVATTTTRANVATYTTKNKNMMAKVNFNDTFSIILTREDVKEAKPHPEVHRKIMKELGVTPAECIVVEDSLIGVEAAVRAGIDAVTMYDRYSDYDREEINKKSLHLFMDFREMLEFVKDELEC